MVNFNWIKNLWFVWFSRFFHGTPIHISRTHSLHSLGNAALWPSSEIQSNGGKSASLLYCWMWPCWLSGARSEYFSLHDSSMYSESPVVAVGCSCMFCLVHSRRRVRRSKCHMIIAPPSTSKQLNSSWRLHWQTLHDSSSLALLIRTIVEVFL